VCVGHFTKRGHFRKNWKTRFFVLELGRLSYFEKAAAKQCVSECVSECASECVSGENFLKSMVLRNVGLCHDPDPRMIALADRLGKKDLLMRASTVQLADAWRKVSE
jgi:hypothetical protein